ncbi:unnamed protein product [Leptidea sinapis]|uniref:MYND-type domain-containing protein n=1 Tax=Leptidea sinapis TaxID=189913 RepID=A0A5E4QR37_9NEOP|nr:unnamed protein product [Leptidea sinapis]
MYMHTSFAEGPKAYSKDDKGPFIVHVSGEVSDLPMAGTSIRALKFGLFLHKNKFMHFAKDGVKSVGRNRRVPARVCLACGAPADFYCAGCLVAPYCCSQCQKTDWNRRHKNTCHNLAGVTAAKACGPKSPNNNAARDTADEKTRNCGEKPAESNSGIDKRLLSVPANRR